MRITELCFLAATLVSGKKLGDKAGLRGGVGNEGNCGEHLQISCQDPSYPCCSPSNWCGVEPAYCDNKQELWSYVAPPPVPWSKELGCQLAYKDRCAPDALEEGFCVSQYGWCGNTPDHCNSASLFSKCCLDGYVPVDKQTDVESFLQIVEDPPANAGEPSIDDVNAAADAASEAAEAVPELPPNTGGGSCTAAPSPPAGWDVTPPASYSMR